MNIRERASYTAQMAVFRALLAVERVQNGVAWNPLSRQYQIDPYPTYRALQQKSPVHRSRAIGYVISRHADVSAMLRDPRFLTNNRKLEDFRKRQEDMIRAGEITREEAETESMLRSDPPDHTRLRSLVSKAFTPRSVEALRPRIEQIVDELLDQAAAKSTFDVIEEIAYPLPVIVIAEMLGIPPEDREQFKRWSDDIVTQLGISGLDEMRRARAANRALRAYLEPIIEERRREPREDLLSALVAAEEEGDKLSINEVHATIGLLLVAGNETTTNLIGNGLLALLRHPDQLERLRDNPDLIGTATEELLRYDSPVQATSRFVLEDAELNGHTIKANREIIMLLGAANRDPEQFPNPDTLDIAREDNRHLAFGQGIHYCLGAPLARLEGPIALNAILQRLPNIRLATAQPVWGANIILRGLKQLPVTT